MATSSTNVPSYKPNNLPDGSNYQIHIVVSEWNKSITEALTNGAKETLIEAGVRKENIRVWNVPGSFELIYGAKKAQDENPNAVIVIGSIIKGETQHFDFICNAVAQGIKDLNIQSQVPVVFCVLTDNNLQQAKDRSGGKFGNRGVEAALTALNMASLNPKYA